MLNLCSFSTQPYSDYCLASSLYVAVCSLPKAELSRSDTLSHPSYSSRSPFYLSLFPLDERCTPVQFGTSGFFRGLPQPWTNLMIDLAFPDLNLENTVPTNGLPTNYHMYTFLYYPLCFSTRLSFLLTLNNPNTVTSNYPVRPRLPSRRVCPDCLSHPAWFPSSSCHSVLHSHTITQLQLSLCPQISTPTFLDYFSGSLVSFPEVCVFSFSSGHTGFN